MGQLSVGPYFRELGIGAFFHREGGKFHIDINHIKVIVSYTNSRLEIKLNCFNKQEIVVGREKVK